MKRAAALIFCLLFSIGLCFPRASAEKAAPAGDLNADGAVTAADAALVLRMARETSTVGDAAAALADVTGSLSVDTADATAMLLMAVGSLGLFTDLTGELSSPLLGERHMDRFSYLGTVLTDMSYRSDRVSATRSVLWRENSCCFVMDIFIRDISSFRTAFGSGKYRGRNQHVPQMAKDHDAVAAITGDSYATAFSKGPVIRNGVIYEETVDPRLDICVLYRDGRLLTFPPGTTLEQLQAEGEIYQSWSFGPRLLDENGAALTAFNCNEHLSSRNPRAAIGYYEPGHYCFVLVDGRQSKYSAGMTLAQLAALFEELGCKEAYNLDGGQSAVLASKNGVINKPYQDGRYVSDILYIAEPLLPEEIG